jgi:hypothetical protein
MKDQTTLSMANYKKDGLQNGDAKQVIFQTLATV